jgi:hypothetical protein
MEMETSTITRCQLQSMQAMYMGTHTITKCQLQSMQAMYMETHTITKWQLQPMQAIYFSYLVGLFEGTFQPCISKLATFLNNHRKSTFQFTVMRIFNASIRSQTFPPAKMNFHDFDFINMTIGNSVR